MELEALQDLKAPKEFKVTPDKRVMSEPLDLVDLKVTEVLLESQEHLGHPVLAVKAALKVLREAKAIKVIEDSMETKVIVDSEAARVPWVRKA